ncbi:hybrid sensor histidine kinase/response regulator, partial [Streptomyces virginiae]|uniref:hybrid sensor histidine kinase/response regulator n=1 Tax=Streptomyces virginiae TaxID=1961 RepID=UPI00056AFA36
RLTENVNELAGNLTRQVRAIAEVASAVAEGDLTRSITVDASGEVAELKDNINSMVGSLRETTRANQEQDWLKSNLAQISGLMQGHRDLAVVAELVMDELTPLVDASYGAFYLGEEIDGQAGLTLIGSFGRPVESPAATRVRHGETLVGQAARSRRILTTNNVPAGYLISSGLGQAAPAHLIVLPIVVEDQVLGVIELASFAPFTPVHRDFLGRLMETIGVNVNTIVANARTDELLGESQRLTGELQARSEELQVQQEELQQLSLASKYKSEFLANMSHELRTPLNSLLILAQLLAQNPTRNLSPKQVEYAGIIHSAGSDLLQLINDILDLSKVEAGKAPGVPVDLLTDDARLQQILRNLLSNAVKFTEHGRVHVKIEPASSAELPDELTQAGSVVAFRVIDSGIGIAEQQLEAIFAAFQQADGTTSRKYGGTGLGLSITREIARLLGGAVTARSEVGKGSTFTLFLPVSGRELTEDATAALESAQPGSSGAEQPDGAAQPALEEQRHPRRILVIEQRSNGLLSLVAESAASDLTAGRAVTVPADRAEVVTAVTAADAAAVLAQAPFHCVVLELGSDGEGLRFLQALAGDGALASLPVLAHDNRRMTREQQAEVAERAAVQPLEVLTSLDELRERIALHLSADRPGDVPTLVRDASHLAVSEHAVVDASLAGRSVLVVDDDPRNLYAISGILELHGMHVLHAENGRRGIETLTATPGIDLILMDVMMPELDGYAATTEIRRMPEYSALPIISVTAKAMPGDREKSLASGANDYVTKPVDANDLITRLRRWLPAQNTSGTTPA